MGGRSRVAAQMLAGNGFEHVYNLSGGIRAWDTNVAIGGEEQGLHLFSGNESLETILLVAYSLEKGLQEFYTSMIPRVGEEEVRKVFVMLADIEVQHQERIFAFYQQGTTNGMSRTAFQKAVTVNAMEGGMTTEEFIAFVQPDWNSPADVIAIAMSIEAQALDLYQRAARRSTDAKSREFLQQIASEEKSHLARLGQLIDT